MLNRDHRAKLVTKFTVTVVGSVTASGKLGRRLAVRTQQPGTAGNKHPNESSSWSSVLWHIIGLGSTRKKQANTFLARVPLRDDSECFFKSWSPNIL